MNAQDPNVYGVELIARALHNVIDDLVLVGGCSVGLLITDQGSAPVRQTIDIDLVAEVASKAEYYALCERVQNCGFVQTADADHLCRWKKGPLLLDLMPSDATVLGHSTNRWYAAAVQAPISVALPSGIAVHVVAPPLFLATKLEAFYDRGNGDYAHHDMEDIVNVIDGRPDLVKEVLSAAEDVRAYLREEFEELLLSPAFMDQLPNHLRPDAASQARLPKIIRRMRALAGF